MTFLPLALVAPFTLAAFVLEEISGKRAAFLVGGVILITLWTVDHALRSYRFDPESVAVRQFGFWRRYEVPPRVFMSTRDDGGFALWDAGDGPFHVIVDAEFCKQGAGAAEIETLYAECYRLVEDAS